MANNLSQDKIVDAFKKMLEKQPFSSIKVTAIVEAAGVSHMSFYRKYADKYALLEAVCYEDFISFAKIFGRNATWRETCICLLNCVKSHRQFYRKIFLDKEALEPATQAGLNISTEFTGESASEFTNAVWKIVLHNWARNNMDDPVEDVMQTLLEHLPVCDILKKQERQIYLERYKNTTMREFSEQ